jgi:hypothetical protein
LINSSINKIKHIGKYNKLTKNTNNHIYSILILVLGISWKKKIIMGIFSNVKKRFSIPTLMFLIIPLDSKIIDNIYYLVVISKSEFYKKFFNFLFEGFFFFGI